MKGFVEICIELDCRLAQFGQTEDTREVMRRAESENEWFSETDILTAIKAIRTEMLDARKLRHWLASYPMPASNPKRVGVIMAGNIPLVGFFDLLCVLASGHIPYVKLSSKDTVLTEYIISQLLEIEHGLQIYRYEEGCQIDAVIATGGESANLYFSTAFASIPRLLRGSRHSVCVLSGNETRHDMALLSDDVFIYSGLGCRSVSLIFVPRGMHFKLPQRKMCRAYHNNYLRTRAVLTMCRENFEDNGEALLVRGCAEFPTSVSRINIAEYDSVEQVRSWLNDNDATIQCVVSSLDIHSRCVPFGRAQYPTLTDYADEVDTMKFLHSI